MKLGINQVFLDECGKMCYFAVMEARYQKPSSFLDFAINSRVVFREDHSLRGTVKVLNPNDKTLGVLWDAINIHVVVAGYKWQDFYLMELHLSENTYSIA